MIRLFISALSFLFFLASPLFGQYGNPNSAGTYGLGMGDIVTIHTGPENCFSNPANLPLADHSSISSYIDSRYFINQLYGTFVGGTYAMENAGFSFNYYNYGWESYAENAVGIAYGRQFLKNFSGGIRFKLLNLNIEEYGRQNAYSVDFGLHQRVTDELTIGLILTNPISTDLGADQTLQSSISMGISYWFNDKFQAAIEFLKEENFDLEAKFGFSYRFLDKITLLGGYQSREHQFSFGFQFKPTQKIDLALSSNLHPTLGVASSFGINYSFN